LPECLTVCIFAEEGPQDFGGVATRTAAGRFELCADTRRLPVDNRVGRVVEQLANDLAPDTRVAAPLNFHKCRDRILIDEQAVQRPAAAATFFVRHGHLPAQQQPAAWSGTIHLVAGKDIGVVGQQALQQIL
jgi:hypothetical protein